MTPDELRSRLTQAVANPDRPSSDYDLNRDVILPENRRLSPAGVLVGITRPNHVPRIILTKRSSRLKHHPGQIAFPGGKVEKTDHDPVAAALREAHEEIGLPPAIPEVIGVLPTHETVTGFVVTPVVCLITQDFTPHLDRNEVDEVFEIPLDALIDPNRYIIQSRFFRGTQRFYYTVPWGPYYVWGATARILRGLTDRLA